MMDKARPDKELTERLRDWSDNQHGDSADALLKLVYTELHRQAHRHLQKERRGHTLQTTALVHETYLKLINQESVTWESRSHFFGVAATMMRRILIDYAKTKHRIKRGGNVEDLPLENALTVAVSDTNFDLLELDEALTRLTPKGSTSCKSCRTQIFQRIRRG